MLFLYPIQSDKITQPCRIGMATGTIKTGWNLVWTNPNPSADFASQTISLDLSRYSEIMITASANANDIYVNDYIMMIDGLSKIMELLINVEATDNVQIISRRVTPTKSSVTFADAYDKAITQNTGTVKNIRLRPYYIYAR